MGSRGGGEGVRGGGVPPPPRNVRIPPGTENYWAVNHSAHGNVILSVVTKANLLMQSMQGSAIALRERIIWSKCCSGGLRFFL